MSVYVTAYTLARVERGYKSFVKNKPIFTAVRDD